jgi:hypothetical protein
MYVKTSMSCEAIHHLLYRQLLMTIHPEASALQCTHLQNSIKYFHTKHYDLEYAYRIRYIFSLITKTNFIVVIQKYIYHTVINLNKVGVQCSSWKGTLSKVTLLGYFLCIFVLTTTERVLSTRLSKWGTIKTSVSILWDLFIPLQCYWLKNNKNIATFTISTSYQIEELHLSLMVIMINVIFWSNNFPPKKNKLKCMFGFDLVSKVEQFQHDDLGYDIYIDLLVHR